MVDFGYVATGWCQHFFRSICIGWAVLLLFIILAFVSCVCLAIYLATLSICCEPETRNLVITYTKAILCCRAGPAPARRPCFIYNHEQTV